MMQRFGNQPDEACGEFLKGQSFAFSERSELIAHARSLAAKTLAQIYSSLHPDEELHHLWAAFPPDPQALLEVAFANAIKDPPQGYVAPPLSFLSLQEGAHDIDFLRTIIEQPYVRLDELYEVFPSPREACRVAATLLRGKSMARSMAFILLAKVCCDDTQPYSAEACLFSSMVFSLAQSIGTDEDKRLVLELQATLAVSSSQTWENLFRHSLESLPKTANNRGSRQEMMGKILHFSEPRPFCWALTQALSRGCEPDFSQWILSRLIERPLPGTPALTKLLSRIVQSQEPSDQSDCMRLLSNISGFTGDYWGELSPWSFERPLRILDECSVDPLALRRVVCPNIRLSTFLAACNLADCTTELLAALDRGFRKRPHLSNESNEWLSEQLRQSVYRAAFLTPREHVRVLDELSSVDLADQDQLLRFCTSLSRASVSQRRSFPHIAAYRLITSKGPLFELPHSIGGAIFSDMHNFSRAHSESQEGVSHEGVEQVSDVAPDQELSPDEEHLLAVLGINPVESPRIQLAQLQSEPNNTCDWLGDDSFQYRALGLPPGDVGRVFSLRAGTVTPVQEFVRAQTIAAPIPGLLDLLGEALSHYQPGDSTVFTAWRHNCSNPVVARQLRSLNRENLETWSTDLSGGLVDEPVGTAVPQRHLGGKAQYQLFFTHHPEVLLRVGAIPSFTAACTSYNNAAYYSKALASFLVDAHVKALIVLDTHKLLHEVAPRLPKEFVDALRSNAFSDDIFSKYCAEVMTAAEVRTVVKLVETPEGKPVLLMQPSFIRGSFKKMHNSLESARFVKAIADMMGAGIATRAYVNQGSWPLQTFILPPSRSPGGQLENHDFATWLSGHHGVTAISGSLLQSPQ